MIVNGEKDCGVNIRPEPFTDIYEVHSEIGRGKFAVVKRCIHRVSGVDYAAKFLHKRRRGRDSRHEALHEIHMLQLTHNNPRIIDLLDVFETSHDLVLVTEYLSGGELFQHIDVEGRIDEPTTVRLLRQILEGVACLHGNNILHMDIKPQNILLTAPLPTGDVKLCDLGLARPFNSGTDVVEIVGTLDYVAPEVLDYVSLDASADMWSVGVLAYVMLTGCSPFAGDTRQETLLNISQVNLDFPDELFSSVTHDAQDFMRRLLTRNTRKRMTAEESLQHDWLQTSATKQQQQQQSSSADTNCTDSCSTADVNVSADAIPTAVTDISDICTTTGTSDTCSDTKSSVPAVGPETDTRVSTRSLVSVSSPVVPAAAADHITFACLLPTPAVPLTPAASPSLSRCRISSIYDSPSGQRRALTATLTVDEVLTSHEPAKKCRCEMDEMSTSLDTAATASVSSAATSSSSSNIARCLSDDKENNQVFVETLTPARKLCSVVETVSAASELNVVFTAVACCVSIT